MSRTKHHGDKAKKRAYGINWLWLQATPGWWVRLFMTRPQRRAAAVWQRKVETCVDIEWVERLDKPPHGKKPHLYFW